METLDKEAFKNRKKSDTIVVYGCGASINELTDEDKETFSRYDSIAFNWFCKSHIPTTFYFLREQGTAKVFALRGESHDVLVRDLTRFYKRTCLVIDNLNTSSPRRRKINTYSKKVIYDNY